MSTRRTSSRITSARKKSRPPAAVSGSPRKKTIPAPGSRLAAASTAVRGAVTAAATAVSERLPWKRDTEDALSMLESDHRRMEELLRQGEETGEEAAARRTQLLDTLTAELNLHERLEERILYPALRAHPEANEIVLEGYQEHHVVDLIVDELHDLAKDDERWGAKFKVLKENIEHHIEEEEGEMFRIARRVMSGEELEQLGTRIAAMKVDATRGRRTDG